MNIIIPDVCNVEKKITCQQQEDHEGEAFNIGRDRERRKVFLVLTGRFILKNQLILRLY